MTVEWDTGLPSIKLIQNYVRDKAEVVVGLVTGDTVQGTLTWQDPQCLCVNAGGQAVMIWRTAIAYIKPQ